MCLVREYMPPTPSVNSVNRHGLLQVDTEMDFPLAMERPLTEATMPTAITISFFAPRPTLPKMKIIRFVVQVTPSPKRKKTQNTKHKTKNTEQKQTGQTNQVPNERGDRRTDGRTGDAWYIRRRLENIKSSRRLTPF